MDQINNIEIHLEKYFDRLWPICRSIVSPGYRESLDILSEIVPFERLEFPTGKKVLDWTVPEEWDCRDAYFIDSQGVRHADFKVNNLHILNFSAPFRGKVNFEEMQKHLYSLPHLPDAVPYITSYYEKRWGFCISENERKNLPQGDFEVFIDSVHRHGKLVAGEAVLKGQTKQEILLSSYLCHPSLANNELSGPLVLAFLYDALKKKAQRKFTYRFVVVPETIGSIAYLSKRGEHLRRNVVAGYQITCAGDAGAFTYKKSRQGNCLSDRAAEAVLKTSNHSYIIHDFDPSQGSDERQYCSPGYNLPVGSLMRTMYNKYPEYHTSLDDKKFISFSAMAETVNVYVRMIELIEANEVFVNAVMRGEPHLSKYGLYSSLGSVPQKEKESFRSAIMWILNLADGSHDTIDAALRSKLPLEVLIQAVAALRNAKLVYKGSHAK